MRVRRCKETTREMGLSHEPDIELAAKRLSSHECVSEREAKIEGA